MSDYRLYARRRKFADQRRQKVIAQAHGAQRPRRVQNPARQVGHHSRYQHDLEALFGAVLVQRLKPPAFADDSFRRVAE